MKPTPEHRHLPALLAALLLLFLTPARVAAQPHITLDSCYRKAERTYPLRRQLALLDASNALKVKNLNKNYLPAFNVGGNISLQSAVTEVAIVLPKGLPELSMPTLSKDWYKLTLDVNQAVYDGNVTSYQKQVEAINLQADLKGVEVELYKVKDRINQVYFTILLIEKNEALLASNRDRIEKKLAEVESGIRNGAALEMNADLLRAELEKLDQQMQEARADRSASVRMLGELIGEPVSEDTVLDWPEIAMPDQTFEDRRPEYALFDIQRGKTDLMRRMVTTKWNPKVFAYGQLGYGRPSLNMLDDSFMPWWVIGAKVTWNPWNWNQNKNEKQIYAIQGDLLKSQQETFDKNLRVTSQKELGDMLKYAGLLEQDNRIITLREKITRAASSQLDNGVITSSDYLARLSEETQARLNLEIHRIQLTKAKLSYLFTLGKL